MSRSELAQLELLAEVDALVARLHRWADDAPTWAPAEKCRALVRRLADRVTSLRVRMEAPLVVATLGGTGTGKSALVNALLGSEVVQTGRERPTTTRPTIICRPDVTPDVLGIDPASVELVQLDLPVLSELVLIDCPDPDTTEEEALTPTGGGEGEAAALIPGPSPNQPTVGARRGERDGPGPSSKASNLARLRAILPKCDVLLVTGTQQKYRSARVAQELTAAACGVQVVFVQTHAESEDDVRDDWRRVLADLHDTEHIFFVDSLRALACAQAGLQPRGEFAALLDRVTRQMAGTAAIRIRRANFLDLAAETLAACREWIDRALPAVQPLQAAILEQRGLLAAQLVRDMRAELLASRRPWEQRLLAETTSRWGFSPFSLVLRVYQGLGTLLTGVLLYRARTPAQVALWGTMKGVRTWQRQRGRQQARRALGQVASTCWDPCDLRKATLIVQGYADDAGLTHAAASLDDVPREAETAAAGFMARVSTDLDALIRRLAERHTGWFTRWRYEGLLAAMLAFLLYRLGKNFFYDSWLASHPAPMFGLEFYVSAGFWFVVWCLLLLWAFCSRLRRGLRSELDRLAESWRDTSSAVELFTALERAGEGCERFRQELAALQQHVSHLQRQVAASDTEGCLQESGADTRTFSPPRSVCGG
jgi:GTPase SAR1 family protein